ncbi:LLM class flavin-dependent oxidoreductase [Paenibacillus sp. N1-5-1-14]|uniref:LLM class flavin-dependent oxidoreductase n=1 Tax=Paenibacillus radicibacter TaxID=2972488 RepID=UPI00215945BD|nr:LLM class flavin-dependent oxidoreductase [Paenibacillus radicibacter]MCR8642743.1 LLM class flavin-dependent oxidoreductase [Paenibacillus radicibacter]
MIELSVLDQSPISAGSSAGEALENTARLAQEVEMMGYKRFWVSEHHFSQSLAGSSPEVLISHLGAKTSRIRIGSGGVMLPHYSSYKVAENFRLLEALYPRRIDLGLGRAPGGMPLSTQALQEGKVSGVDQYPQQLDDLIDYLHDRTETHRFRGLRAAPVIHTRPEMWLLGSSGDSAALAAKRGASFAFAHFINGQGGEEVMQRYLETFQPTIVGNKPQGMVAVFAICAETEELANEIASSLDLTLLLMSKGDFSSGGVPSIQTAQSYPYTTIDRMRMYENRKRMIVGNPEQVKARILELSDAYQSREVMIVTITHDIEHKLQSYRLIAKAFSEHKD